MGVSVRIKFSADLVIEADTMEEAREKWCSMSLFSDEAMECDAEFCEELLIEDAESYEDVKDEFWND